MLILPGLASQTGGRVAWMVTIAAWLVAALGIVLAVAAAGSHPAAALPDALVRKAGLIPALLLGALVLLVALAIGAGDLVWIHSTIDEVLLLHTPAPAVFVGTILVAGYGAWIGWGGLARLSGLLLLIVVGSSLLLVALIMPMGEIGYLLPLFDLTQVRWDAMSLLGSLTAYHSPVLVFFLYARAERQERVRRDFLLGSLMAGATALLMTVACQTLTSPEVARRVDQLFPDIIGVVALSRSLVDRPEHLARIIYDLSAITSASAVLLAGAETLAALSGVRRWRLWVPVVAAATVAVAYLSYRFEVRRQLMLVAGGSVYGLIVLVALISRLTALGRARSD